MDYWFYDLEVEFMKNPTSGLALRPLVLMEEEWKLQNGVPS